jgi:AcrR family transcriptional regulator
VTARPVAREAGVATDALYYHFPDFDDFLAALVFDRVRVQAERMSGFGGARARARWRRTRPMPLLLHGSGLPRPADVTRCLAAAVLTGLTERAP